MKRPYFHRRAVALLITLACLVIMTIVFVGFAISMRTDRPAAATYFEKMRATQFAQTGVETAVAKLHQYAATMAGSGTSNWISQPGELIVNGSSSGYSLTTAVPLSSGSAPVVTDPSFQPPNLNVPMFRDQYNLISDGTTPLAMPVAWIYVRSSGTLDISSQPLLNNTADPIVGRYAYWMDDESSKINYNIAWGRDSSNTNPPNSPTHVDLTALNGFTSTMADAMRSALLGGSSQLMGTGTTQQFSFFNTPEDARRVESSQSGIAAALGNNQFDVTHYNHDPDTTFFNQPRIVLTTQPSRAGWTYNKGTGKWTGGQPYLDILSNTYLTTSGTFADPGPLSYQSGSTVDYSKLTNTIYFLMSYMQRTDWPMIQGSGNSLQSKYFPWAPYPKGYPSSLLSSERLAQLAIDIIDYVRSKESPQQLVLPLRVTHNTPASYPIPFQVSGTFPGFQCTASPAPPVFGGTEAWTSYSYMGVTRAPRITEMANWFGSASNAAGWGQPGFPSNIPYQSGSASVAVTGTATVRIWEMEVNLPKHFGIQWLDLTQLYWYIEGDNTGGNGGVNQINAVGTYCTPGSILTSGSCLTVRRVVGNWQYDSNPQSICFALSTTITNNRLDKSPLTSSTGSAAYAVTEQTNAKGTPESQVQSFEVDDPRVNKSVADWRLSTNANHNTFGAPNSIYSVGKPASSVSPQPLQSTGSAYGAQLDTGTDGNITDASLYMPPPAGQIIHYGDGVVDDNSAGVVQSVAELGYISTGVECVGWVPQSNGSSTYVQLPAGTPWRTIRLQPNNQESTIVPDWAFMDLFTVPAVITSSNAQPIYAPHNVSVGGRVNINSQVAPFGMQRILPLTAVLQGCPYDSTNSSAVLSATAAQGIAQNIINQTVATNGKMYTMNTSQSGTSPSCYNSPGQVVEISGVADQGEKSEALIRAISNLITARGSVFSAYTIGQALKQTPNGKIVVTGEQRLQAMIESYLYTNPTSGVTTVRFNPVYYRNLTP